MGTKYALKAEKQAFKRSARVSALGAPDSRFGARIGTEAKSRR
jgi:hypothetical protein